MIFQVGMYEIILYRLIYNLIFGSTQNEYIFFFYQYGKAFFGYLSHVLITIFVCVFQNFY